MRPTASFEPPPRRGTGGGKPRLAGGVLGWSKKNIRPSRRCNAIATAFKQHLNSVATHRAKSTSRIARCGQTTGRPMPPVRDQGQPRRGTGSVGLTLEGLEVGPPRPRLSPSTEGFGEASPAWQAGYWGGRKKIGSSEIWSGVFFAPAYCIPATTGTAADGDTDADKKYAEETA